MADITSVDLARIPGDNQLAASPDLLRAMVQTFAEALMGADADAICGAPYGQRPVQQARGACQAARTRTATPSSARSSYFCCIAAGCRPGC